MFICYNAFFLLDTHLYAHLYIISILSSFLLKSSFNCILPLTFVTFLIHRHLFLAGFCVHWCQPYFVCSVLTSEIYSGGGPSMYVYGVDCYRMIAVPCVRMKCNVFTHLYTLVDNLEHPFTISFVYYLMSFQFHPFIRTTPLICQHQTFPFPNWEASSVLYWRQ